jgi:hypothetical protein
MHNKTTVEDELRQRVQSYGPGVWDLSKRVGVCCPSIWWFATVDGAGISLETAQRLLDFFGLEVVPRQRQP